jgi:hypothetical protein
MAKFIPPHGGYEELLSFRKARIIYDGTVRFCERFMEKRDRTRDQMVQNKTSRKAAKSPELPKKPKSS